MRIVITAGYDRSLAAIALCECLKQSGHEIVAVLVISLFNLKRIKRFYSQRGVCGLVAGVLKHSGANSGAAIVSPLRNLLQANSIEERSLKSWCQNNGVRYMKVRDINSRKSVQLLKASSPNLVVYAGGGILGKKFIEAANGNIINPHSGPLPQIRGMNAIEWALLLDEPLQATVHIINEGIDSGLILGRFNVIVEPTETIDSLREKAVVTGINGLVGLLYDVSQLEDVPTEPNTCLRGTRQCFVMAPALKELVELKLSKLAAATSA